MATSDMLQYGEIPLNHKSGAVPAVEFGGLSPDTLAINKENTIAMEVWLRHLGRTKPCFNDEVVVGNAMQAVWRVACQSCRSVSRQPAVR